MSAHEPIIARLSSLALEILAETWGVVLDAAPWMLLGVVVAGLLKAFLPDRVVARHLGANSRFAVLKAALIGAPLPLCSCGVLPAAAGLRRQGAGKGPTAAFMVSTPETGVDSIAVTYALLDPLMAVLRPVAAIVTAVLTGLGVGWLDKREGRPGEGALASVAAPEAGAGQARAHDMTSSGADRKTLERRLEPLVPILPSMGAVTKDQAHGGCGCGDKGCGVPPASPGFIGRVRSGLSYAFLDILGDVGPWFMAGALAAGAFIALAPPQLLSENLGTGLWAMLAALAVSLPLYVCATATTPLVAALAMKGLSPGAALVFLLAGPATNAATVAVVAGMLGRRAAMVYVAAIAVCALLMGAAANWLYLRLGMDVAGWVAVSGEETHGPFAIIAGVVMLGCMAYGYARRKLTGHAADCAVEAKV